MPAQPATDIERVERRFLVKRPGGVALLLDEMAEPDAYHVLTVYLLPDSPDGTRHRLRFYDDEATGWLEDKTTKGQTVTKHRTQSKLGRGDVPDGMRAIGQVQYDRQAWDLPHDLRVTVDRNVQTSGRVLPSSVVEVKGDDVPPWLAAMLPSEDKDFSKRRWMLGKA